MFAVEKFDCHYKYHLTDDKRLDELPERVYAYE